MKTLIDNRSWRALAAVVSLMALTACGSSVTPISGSGSQANNSGGSTNPYTNPYGSGSTGNTSLGGGNTGGNTGGSTGGNTGGSTGGNTGGSTGGATVLTPTTPWANARVAEGDVHSCLLDTSGGAWCWGHNSAGQLGNGTTTDSEFVGRVSNLTSGLVSIAAGGYHTCALDSNHGVWCWGANDSGQLGDGTTTNRTTPVQVPGLTSGVQALALGYAHTCAIDSRGVIWCWGSNAYGQLGNNSTTDSHSPVPTSGFAGAGVALALGYHHSCATASNGALYCWGYNSAGRLGDGTTTNRSIPTQVQGLSTSIVAVSAGYTHTCALDSTGVLWCWGSNYYGQLGTGNQSNNASQQLTPVSVTVPIGISTLAVGGYHTCVTDGTTVDCWGWNYYGQSGNPTIATNTPIASPAGVSGLSGAVRALASGGYHSCVLDGEGMQCWGSDYYDQLGDGTYRDSGTPVQTAYVTPASH